MSQADLVADLKASLQDSASVFTAANDEDFKRHLTTAALEFLRLRPRTLLGSLELIADLADYAAPADFYAIKSPLWGIAPKPRGRPWERAWPGKLPIVRAVEVSGVRKLYLDPPPSAAQISALGSEFRYYYYAAHVIHATDGAQTTIQPGDRGLLLLRSQAEALREMALRNLKKPVALRDGLGSAPRNGTPAALYEALLDEFEQKAA